MNPDLELPAAVLLAVNGGLMRGLKDNDRMLTAGGTFVREAATEPTFRLWSVNDDYPAMVRVNSAGASVAVEVWSITPAGLVQVLRKEPYELTLGRFALDDGTEVIGVLGESAMLEGQREITEHGGWRAYLQVEGIDG